MLYFRLVDVPFWIARYKGFHDISILFMLWTLIYRIENDLPETILSSSNCIWSSWKYFLYRVPFTRRRRRQHLLQKHSAHIAPKHDAIAMANSNTDIPTTIYNRYLWLSSSAKPFNPSTISSTFTTTVNEGMLWLQKLLEKWHKRHSVNANAENKFQTNNLLVALHYSFDIKIITQVKNKRFYLYLSEIK